MKQLIITGDDFGRSHEVNEAIERAHAAGFLTQASLMVNEPCAEEAVRIAQRHPTLCVGLHLTLCDGRASAVSALTDETGRFSSSPAWAWMRYAFLPSLTEPLRREIDAQFTRFCAFGLEPTYWDGHTHLHLQHKLFYLALPIALARGFRGMRVVRDRGPWALTPEVLAIRSAATLKPLRRNSLAFADYTFGLRDTGAITTEVAVRILQNLPDGLSEFYFHPGAEPRELDYPRLCALIEERAIKLRTLPQPPAAH